MHEGPGRRRGDRALPSTGEAGV